MDEAAFLSEPKTQAMNWGIVSAACAVLGFVLHALSEWQNTRTRAAVAELKVWVCDRQSIESERFRDLVTPLGTDVARVGARLDAVERDVGLLQTARAPRL